MRANKRILTLVSIFLVAPPAFARQNIFIGEMAVGVDYQDRNYDENDVDAEVTTDSGTVTVNEVTDTGGTTDGAAAAPRVIILEDNRGDRQRYFVTPRMRLSSQGISDLLEFTYAPTFSYDDVYADSEIDHDLRLLLENDLTRNWAIRATNSFYYGEDPVHDEELRTATIIPGQEEPVTEPTVGAAPTEQEGQALTESLGRRRYWRNDLSLFTDYDYAQDSTAGIGYNFGMLRNNDNTDISGYTDYDRHEGIVRVSYRFSTQWRTELEGRYVKGIYDDREVFVVTPATEPEAEETTATDEEGAEVTQPVTEAPAAPTVDQLDNLSDDLQEYHALWRLDYDWRPHDVFFGRYQYSLTDYEASLREDAAIHEFALGWDHDFTSQWHVTLSAGPTFIKYDNSPNTTDYNAYAGLLWNGLHSSLNVFGERGFDYENFDGRRDGLTEYWRTGLEYTYQFTPAFNCAASANYQKNNRDQLPSTGTIVIVDDGTLDPESTTDTTVADLTDINTSYTEDIYDVGFSLNYSFLRWYTISGSYRYYNLRSGAEQDYDEHRFFVTLSVSKEFFRW